MCRLSEELRMVRRSRDEGLVDECHVDLAGLQFSGHQVLRRFYDLQAHARVLFPEFGEEHRQDHRRQCGVAADGDWSRQLAVRTHRDDSLISGLLSMPGETMPIEQIRANIKMTIGGGLNEPRDALGVAALAMFHHPEQRAAAMANPALWPTVFEETIRWIAPIGMYSRQTTQDTVLAGTHLPAGAKLGICVLSANRDETVCDNSDQFNIHREAKPHLAFSKGVHVCLGGASRNRRSGTASALQQPQRTEDRRVPRNDNGRLGLPGHALASRHLVEGQPGTQLWGRSHRGSLLGGSTRGFRWCGAEGRGHRCGAVRML